MIEVNSNNETALDYRNPWLVSWSGVWIGALAALAVALVIGLVAIAVGAHVIGPSERIVKWSTFSIGALIFSIFGAFVAFVVGGWVAAKIAGIARAEPAMLHGAIAWLLTVPMLLVFTGLGAGTYFGSWYTGLAGTPSWAHSATPADILSSNSRRDSVVMPSQDKVVAAKDEAERESATVARNSALGAVTALLLGLIGSVIGGWMASGEPMTLTHYRKPFSARISREELARSS
jgi:hypothetical protein